MKKYRNFETEVNDFLVFSSTEDMTKYYKSLYNNFNGFKNDKDKQDTVKNLTNYILGGIKENDDTYLKVKKSTYILKLRKLKYRIEEKLFAYENSNKELNEDMLQIYIEEGCYITTYTNYLIVLADYLMKKKDISENEVKALTALYSVIVMSYLNNSIAFESKIDGTINKHRNITYIDNSGINIKEQLIFIDYLFKELIKNEKVEKKMMH